MTRVAIVDDSDLTRRILREILESDSDIQIVAEGVDGAAAVDIAAKLKPDLITIDIQMPRMNGLDAIRKIMSQAPVPILVLTSLPTGPNSDVVFQAIGGGALDVMSKSQIGDSTWGDRLRERVHMLASVRVVRHVGHREPEAPASPNEPAPKEVARPRCLAIGASAGGPAALAAVLGLLPATFELPVLVVQHLPAGFVPSFAQFLQDRTQLRVHLLKERFELAPGVVLVASQHHMIVESRAVAIELDREAVSGHKPSVDVLFESVGDVFGGSSIGVLLSGMGRDGAKGLLHMRQRGAVTVAQDEDTSAVFGMPQAAIEIGAVEDVLPLSSIPARLIELAKTS